jgi:hypothetical protein
MCPVCAVAVGVGLGLSRWLKIDDAVSGLWVGALIVSLSFVLAKWTKKNLTFVYFIFFLLTTIIPLYYYKIIGNPLNTLWGVDKLLLGTATGIILFVLSLLLHGFLKSHNHNKSYFPFQKVIIPVVTLTLASLILYWRIYAGS